MSPGRRAARAPVPWLALACAAGAGCDAGDDSQRERPSLLGYVVTRSDDRLANRCAVDPVGDIESGIDADPAYVLGYRSGKSDACGGSVAAPYVAGDGDEYHRQSVQRLHLDGRNYLLVTQSLPPADESDWSPGLEVVVMGAHGGTGEALGSGGAAPMGRPDCENHVVHYLQHDSPGRRHAGGMQVSGHVAVVALEDSGDRVPAAFLTVDLSDPGAPNAGSEVLRQAGATTDGGAAALTRLADGRFLVALFGHHSWEVELFVSAEDHMPLSSSEWISKGAWRLPFGAPTTRYQNVQLVTRCDDGALYALATEQDDSGEERADLWRVSIDPMSYRPTFSSAARAVMECCTANTGDIRFCHFHAGAGTYIDPSGHLILYGIEHTNTFSLVDDDTGVRLREFPHR